MSNNLRSEESGNSELHPSGEPLDSTKQENYTSKPAQNLNTAKGNPERLLKGSQKHSAKTRPEFQNRKQVRPKHNSIWGSRAIKTRCLALINNFSL